MVEPGEPCPTCGTELLKIDVESPHMNAVCPKCAPDIVMDSPAIAGGDGDE